MRDAFLASLTKLAQLDPDVVFLTADLGFGVFEQFEQRFSGQYFNVGVAEQNMTSLATGLALENKKVITYSIANFPTLRCLEQIRNDACYHNVNITIVASGGGFSYGALGMSHHATEDLAILRALPDIKVVAPCTKYEAGIATTNLVNSSGVGYLRLDKTTGKNNPSLDFSLGKAVIHRNGSDITLVTTGGILQDVQIAADQLENFGISAKVLGMHTIKPIDEQAIIKATQETAGIITIEEHNIVGGLGSAVAEVCMDNNIIPKAFARIAIQDKYSAVVGDQHYLRKHYQIDSQAIVAKAKEILSK